MDEQQALNAVVLEFRKELLRCDGRVDLPSVIRDLGVVARTPRTRALLRNLLTAEHEWYRWFGSPHAVLRAEEDDADG
ncbi:MAG: hypothetical protein U1E76_03375 [Planctomycetota bacterium]